MCFATYTYLRHGWRNTSLVHLGGGAGPGTLGHLVAHRADIMRSVECTVRNDNGGVQLEQRACAAEVGEANIILTLV